LWEWEREECKKKEYIREAGGGELKLINLLIMAATDAGVHPKHSLLFLTNPVSSEAPSNTVSAQAHTHAPHPYPAKKIHARAGCWPADKKNEL